MIQGSSCTFCEFKSVAAKSLDEEELQFMNRNCAEVLMQSGDQIFKEGTLSSHIAYIKHGLAKVHAAGPSGKEQILKLASSGAYIGIQTILAAKVHLFSATCLKESHICYIDNTFFRSLILKNSLFASGLITYLCRDELDYFKRFLALSQKQVNGRLADALIYFSEMNEGAAEYHLPLDRSELASFTGTTRESVTRAFGEMVKSDVIKLTGRKLEILKPQVLAEISQKG